MSQNLAQRFEDIASIAHAANRAYCETLGDYSQPLWERLEPERKTIVVAGVRAIFEHPTITPEDCHQKWVEAHAKAGWHYGPTLDRARKIHPCMVPYHELSAEQKRKDLLFRAVVSIMLLELEPETVPA